MFFVQCNSIDQVAHLALKQGSSWLSPGAHPYLLRFVHEATGKDLVVIPSITFQSERITTLLFDTDNNDPLNRGMLLVDPGRYAYYVYQNSTPVNLLPNLSLGLIEQGFMEALPTETYYNTPTFNTPSDYIYNG
jgi:hypothetical protein